MNSLAQISSGGTQPVPAAITTGGLEVIGRVSDEWQALCDASDAPPFYWPFWIEAYIRAFEPARPVVLLTVRDGASLKAVLPLVRKRGWLGGMPVSMLCGTANVHSVRFDIVSAENRSCGGVIPRLWALVEATPNWDVLHLPAFPENSACHELVRHAERHGFHAVISPRNNGPIVRIRNSDGRSWQDGASRHFRHELRRYSRLIIEELGGAPELVRWTSPDQDALSRFYALESAGWKGSAGTAISCHAETRAFYDEVAAAAARHGAFCLHALEWNGRMIAAAFSVTSRSCYFPLKIAYDESLHRAAPGHLLFNAILEKCAAAGFTGLYFGGEDDRYKTAWTAERIPHYDGFVFSPGVVSQVAYHVKAELMPSMKNLGRRLHLC